MSVTISYDPCCDAKKPVKTEVGVGMMSRSAKSLARYGFWFEGWYEDKNYTIPMKKDLEQYQSDIIVYAKWKKWDGLTAERMDIYLKEMREAKYIISRAPAYEKSGFYPYYVVAVQLLFGFESNKQQMDDAVYEMVCRLKELREKLVLVVSDPEDVAWYIWGDKMPQEPNADDYDYYYTFDYKGFKPFIVPFLLKDQTKVKGNIIDIAGGGFSQRWHQTEGYCIAEEFNKLGYNVFVLQRRVEPSLPVDAFLDLQRSIRFIRYQAEKLGIGATDRVATVGFSGGGMTIIGALEKAYGFIKPNAIYHDYIPDAIDDVNSDYQSAMIIYGGLRPFASENPNLPAFFAAVGIKDSMYRGMLNFFASLDPDAVTAELHVFPEAAHGFGTGKGYGAEIPKLGYIGADEWIHLADIFTEVEFGIRARTYQVGKKYRQE